MSSLELSDSAADTVPTKSIAPSTAWQPAAWRIMFVANVCLMAALFIYKIKFSSPDLQYTLLLADYHFGFMKRALIGALAGLVFPELPTWAPYALGTAIWFANLGVFVMLFDKVFGLRREMPLFVFTIASPLFLKNFIQTLGYYDIYGCLLATIFLLVPARSAVYVLSAAAAAVVLLVIHHLHMLLYIPTLIVIVAFRYYLVRPIRRADLLIAGASLVLLAAVFLFLQFAGSPAVPIEQLEAYMNSRMTGPPLRGTIWVAIFYRTVGEELHDTWSFMSTNLLRFPVYIAVVALHWPLIRLFRSIIEDLASPLHRRLVVAAIAAVSLGYVIIFAVIFDYSRWVASWATCMILLLLATKQLATACGTSTASFGERRARGFAWILTFVPRLGTVTPF